VRCRLTFDTAALRKGFTYEITPSRAGGIESRDFSCYGSAMPATLTIHDENSVGEKLRSFTLECLNERMTLREIIRARIYQEVRDHNQSTRKVFHGLIQPSDTKQAVTT
jgi:hypothetical protein